MSGAQYPPGQHPMMGMMPLPSEEQRARAKWDLLLLDIEHRSEQVRQMKAFEGRRLAIQAFGAGGTVFIAGAAVGALLLQLFK